jgi:colanic acid/amylovoran biosynthesis protein
METKEATTTNNGKKRRRILLIGQCTVHWGRLEFGNIGNYYIVETTVRELHRVFPEAEIATTFQMTNEFCVRERITCLPLDLFYSWSGHDVELGTKEFGIATIYNITGRLVGSTPYIEEVLKSDLVIDFSGEMWGDHAEPIGKDRFLVGLLKDRVAQLLNKRVVLLAGSQGPFSDENVAELARLVFRNFALVANRESASAELLKSCGFEIDKVRSYSCPAFLFEPRPENEMKQIFAEEKIVDKNKRTVGFILCGFNMLQGPYDRWPREDAEYIQFAEAVEYIVSNLGARVVLMSHQNGFELPPNFKLIQGRDYPIVKQLESVVAKRKKVAMENVFCLKNPYGPRETKAIIKQFDMFVSGRVHAFVAAVSQNVPTVLITRGFGPVSHRNIGFARSVGLEEYIADPRSSDDIKQKIRKCWNQRDELRRVLEKRVPVVKDLARSAFDSLREI